MAKNSYAKMVIDFTRMPKQNQQLMEIKRFTGDVLATNVMHAMQERHHKWLTVRTSLTEFILLTILNENFLLKTNFKSLFRLLSGYDMVQFKTAHTHPPEYFDTFA